MAVYSERLLVATAGAAVSTVVVPAGKRAVVKQVFCSNDSSTAGSVVFYVNGLAVWRRAVPGDSALESATLYLVAYSGETLGCWLSRVSMVGTMFGYLFNDDQVGGFQLVEAPAQPVSDAPQSAEPGIEESANGSGSL